jgi:uncharacterized protein YjiS (DUF1127 family)
MALKDAETLRAIVSHSLASAAEHIRTARDAFRALQKKRQNTEELKELTGWIDEALSDCLFHCLTSQIVIYNMTKSSGQAKPN